MKIFGRERPPAHEALLAVGGVSGVRHGLPAWEVERLARVGVERLARVGVERLARVEVERLVRVEVERLERVEAVTRSRGNTRADSQSWRSRARGFALVGSHRGQLQDRKKNVNDYAGTCLWPAAE